MASSADWIDSLLPDRLFSRIHSTAAATRWGEPGAIDDLRTSLEEVFRQVLYFWRKRRRRFGMPLPALVRNLVATADKPTVALLRLVVRWVVTNATVKDRHAFEEILAAIPKGRDVSSLIEDVVFERHPPTLKRLIRHQLVQSENFASCLEWFDPATRSWLVLLRRYPKRIWTVRGLERVMRSRGLPKLDCDALGLLSSKLRTDVLNSPADLLDDAIPAEQIVRAEKDLRAWIAHLRRAGGRSGDHTLTAFLEALIQAKPEALRGVLQGLQASELDADCRALALLPPSYTAAYLSIAPWRAIVKSAAESKTTTPATLAASMERSCPELIAEATSIHPWLFLASTEASESVRPPPALPSVTVPTVPLGPLVSAALRDPALAHRLATTVSLADMRRHSDVAWEVADNPYEGVAFELALCFGIMHTRSFLRFASLWSRGQRAVESGEQVSPFDMLYRTYQIPKRTGGHRTITAPSDELKAVQRLLVHAGFRDLDLPDSVHGFRPGRSIASNASVHCGREMVVNVDIRDFFPSTGLQAIRRACSHLAAGRLSKKALLLVADLCSFRGALPTGAPTSPYIANLVLAPVDRAIETAGRRFDVSYTRYADDLTFSGSAEAKRILPFVRRVLREHGYKLDDKKTGFFRAGRRQVVTGVVVNERANLTRRHRRKLRSAVHRRSLGRMPTWHGEPIGDACLRGHLALLKMFSPVEAARLQESLGRGHDLSH